MVNQKYRNLKRRKINPKRVTKYDRFSEDEQQYESDDLAKIARPQAEILPKFLNRNKGLSNSLTIQWDREDTHSGFLQHRIDSLDYWCMVSAQERLRVRENLMEYSQKYHEFTEKKIPPKLFDTNEFYDHLHIQNTLNDPSYSK